MVCICAVWGHVHTRYVKIVMVAGIREGSVFAPPSVSAASATSSMSPSTSQSRSGSQQRTGSPSASSTQSASQVTTATQTQSQSPSDTASPTTTQTPSQSLSATASPTNTGTASQTPSQTQLQTFSATLTATASHSATCSRTLTPSPTVTSASSSARFSARPYRLLFNPPDLNVHAIVSDSLPPLSVTVTLDTCDAPSVLLSCAAIAAENSSQELGLALAPASNIRVMPSCQGSTSVLPNVVTVGGDFGTGGGWASLSCEAFSPDSGRSIAAGTLSLAIIPTVWPVFDHAIVVSREGLLRSVADGSIFNASEYFSRASCAEIANCSAASAMTIAQQIFSAQFEHGSRVETSALVQPFSVTLLGSTILVLHTNRASFDDSTTVALGNASCSEVAHSPDGRWLSFRTPAATVICPALTSSRDCGYTTLVITNRANESASSYAGTLSCPPFCPGITGTMLVPLAMLSENDLSVRFAVASPAQAGGLATLTTVSSETSLGIYYALACSKSGLYTDPATGACTNVSNPAAALCAFGSGDSCQICPEGCTCPGGARCWTRAGFYSPSENSPAVSSCLPPLASVRCAGWSAGSAETQCGPGYLQGSYLCAACADNFFAVGDGSCAACPVIQGALFSGVHYRAHTTRPIAGAGSWEKYKGLLALVGGVVGFAAAVYGILAVVVFVAGGLFGIIC